MKRIIRHYAISVISQDDLDKKIEKVLSEYLDSDNVSHPVTSKK